LTRLYCPNAGLFLVRIVVGMVWLSLPSASSGSTDCKSVKEKGLPLFTVSADGDFCEWRLAPCEEGDFLVRATGFPTRWAVSGTGPLSPRTGPRYEVLGRSSDPRCLIEARRPGTRIPLRVPESAVVTSGDLLVTVEPFYWPYALDQKRPYVYTLPWWDGPRYVVVLPQNGGTQNAENHARWYRVGPSGAMEPVPTSAVQAWALRRLERAPWLSAAP
jgi:hypothetical protein